MGEERFHRVAEIFRKASEKAASERDAFLDKACDGDSDTRREVDSLLAIDDSMADATEVRPRAAATETRVEAPGPKSIGAYDVQAEIGRGGMGIVYLARDRRLDREVAIKTLPRRWCEDPRFVHRFQREARLLASLDHVNIAKVYHLEEVDTALYLVLEFIPGLTLRELIDQGSMSLDETLNVAHQIALAIEAAHRRGVMHRDLKPPNVKVTPEGRVKVLDFGLAKSFGDTSEHAVAAVTASGAVMGTPGYMSPEQALGEAVGPATDVWSYGCCIYECLTGARAFSGATFNEMISALLEGEPDWDLLPADLPPSVGDVLRQCFERDPERRLADIGVVRSTLEAARGDTPTPVDGRRPAPTNLPTRITSFIGRGEESEEAGRLLAGTRLLTLIGSGGCGKTSLAMALAAEQVETAAYPQGVWLVELAALADPALVPQTLASALGVKEQPGETLLDTVREHLRPRATLIVFDEQLLEACAELAHALLTACPNVRLLATSREGLRIAGETLYRVPSMSLPDDADSLPLDALLGFEAIQLFRERARAAQTDFEITSENARHVLDVCQRLDGIPLAIELAAARVRALSVEELAKRLAGSFKLLAGGSRTALPRHRTLQATIEWSYDLLSEEEKTLLRRLSVFAGGFTLEAAEKVCSDDAVIELEPES